MTQIQIPDSTPIEFHSWFIKPILEIALDSPEKNDLFRSLMNKRLSTDLDKSLEILKQNVEYLLDTNSKKQLLEYLYQICPPHDHHYITWFKRLLGNVSSRLILTYKSEVLTAIAIQEQ